MSHNVTDLTRTFLRSAAETVNVTFQARLQRFASSNPPCGDTPQDCLQSDTHNKPYEAFQTFITVTLSRYDRGIICVSSRNPQNLMPTLQDESGVNRFRRDLISINNFWDALWTEFRLMTDLLCLNMKKYHGAATQTATIISNNRQLMSAAFYPKIKTLSHRIRIRGESDVTQSV